MEIDLQNPIYSRDHVKVTILVIFFTFSEKFPLFLQKSWFPARNHFTETEKTGNHAKYTFATPGSARRGAISQFSSNYGEIHQIPPIIG